MRTAAQRFEYFVYPDPNSGCFIWAGGTTSHGYGVFWDGERRVGAHRYAWELVHGPIPEGLCICHKCDVPCCVNPDHFFLGTKLSNLVDMARKDRGRKGKKGLPFGVTASRHRFRAMVSRGGRQVYLGSFLTLEEAASVAQAERGVSHA
jgi:hypothetical protein